MVPSVNSCALLHLLHMADKSKSLPLLISSLRAKQNPASSPHQM